MVVQREAGRCQLMLFGIPTLVISDDPHLLATARAALADWLTQAPIPEPEIVLRLARDDGPAKGVSPTIRVEGSRLAMAGGGIVGEANARSGEALCRVSAGSIGTPRQLADDVLDPLLLFIATRRGRVPIHAAGIMIGGTAVVLAGPSGSGKSTLALAAMARGLPVLSDDTVYVETVPRLRIWGFPRAIHVFPGDAPPGSNEVRLRGGKLKHAIANSSLHAPRPAGGPAVAGAIDLSPSPCHLLHADRSALVVLASGDALSLEAIASAAAAAALSDLEPGFDLLRAESAAAIAALTATGAWRLRLTRDPDAAIVTLQDRFG